MFSHMLKHEVDGTNQILKDENSRLREQNTELRAEVDKVQRDLNGFSVTKDEMEAAVAVCSNHQSIQSIMCLYENHYEIHTATVFPRHVPVITCYLI